VSAAALRAPRLLAAIRDGLRQSPKRLPFECFYDDLGSALFEAITLLPEYGLTRAGLRLLARNAGEIADRLAPPLDVVELGSGSGRKTQVLLEALAQHALVAYLPVDISPAALAECQRHLGHQPCVTVTPILADHLDGLRQGVARRRPEARLLVLFLGGNIGNFDRDAAQGFLAEIRALLRPADALLIGADLEKPEPILLAAYDDPLGLTAAFNLNVLVRLNRELGARFELRAFAHRARYAAAERRVEMHLVSLAQQTVPIEALGMDVPFASGEALLTESSHRYAAGELARMGEAAGFRCAAEWTDAEWPFTHTLLVAQ
jgi:dimethylhistidine N-methyltransferase